MLSKSLIQFSVDRWGCVSSLLFDLSLNYGGGNEDNGDLLQKASHTDALSAPNTAANHHQPMPLLETPGHSWASLGQALVGSLLLSPGSWCIRFCLRPPRVCFPVLCKFWRLYGGLMVTSSKRAYAKPRSAAPRAPSLRQSTADPDLLRRHPDTILSHSL